MNTVSHVAKGLVILSVGLLLFAVVGPAYAAPTLTSPALVGAQPVDGAISSPPEGAMPQARKLTGQCAYAFDAPPPAPVVHVAPCADPTTGNGSQERPWRNLQQAFAAVTAGQVVYVHDDPNLPVDYSEPDITPMQAGTRTARIRVMGAPGEGMPTLAKPSGAILEKPALRLSRDWWIVERLRIYGDNVTRSAATLVTGSYVVMRHLEVTRAGSANAAITVTGGHDVALLSSRLYEPLVGDAVTGRPARVPTSSQDNQSVVIHNGADRILIKGNESYGHNGDSVQCGEEPGSTTNITIEGNRFHQEEENAVDIKDCVGVTVRGNKLFGFYPARPLSTMRSPHGDAIIVHKDSVGDGANRVLIEHNRFFRNSRSINLAPEAGAVVARRNLIFEARTDHCGLGAGIRAAALNTEIYHNTLHNLPVPATQPGTGCQTWSATERAAIWVDNPRTEQRAVLWNNIVASVQRHFVVSRFAGLDAATNLFDTTPVGGTPSGSLIGDPQFVTDPTNSDYYTEPGSPARDRATPLSAAVGDPVTYCLDNNPPDIGFLESC